MNPHDFKLKIPLYPNGNEDKTDLQMDGQPLIGVRELVFRAGASGFTNIVLEFEADIMIECVAALIAQMHVSDEEDQAIFGGVFDTVADELGMLPILALDGDMKRMFTKRIIELCRERISVAITAPNIVP